MKDELNLTHPIPSLAIMDEMLRLARQYELPTFDKIAFIGAQHKLETTATLFKAIIDLGAKPKNMFFTGKCYSTCPAVEESIKKLGVHVFDDPVPTSPGGYSEACAKVITTMWEQFNNHIKGLPDSEKIEKIVILDDGGRIIEGLNFTTIVRYQVIVIEQTRGGLYSKELTDHGIFPIILVAQCAAKRIIEAPLIATAILTRLKKMVENLEVSKKVCGVIGNGAVGRTVANYLAETGNVVKVFDQIITTKNHANITIVNNIEEIFKECSFVFGCTGRDITEGVKFESIITRDQIWISGSSEDREFNSFLRKYRPKKICNSMDDISYSLQAEKEITITIKQGGFPFNFDKEPWNVPASDIEVTQCCLLGAVMQAAVIENNRIKYKIIEPLQQLNAYIQSFIVTLWGKREEENGGTRFDSAILNMFKIPSWIEENSGKASFIDIEKLKKIFFVPVNLNLLPIDPFYLDMRKFMYGTPLLIQKEKSESKTAIQHLNQSVLKENEPEEPKKLDYQLPTCRP